MIFFASCGNNQTDLVKKEVEIYAKANDVRMTRGGVEFQCDLKGGYSFVLNSRIATRTLLAFYHDEDIKSADELYEATKAIAWEEYINPERTIKVTETVISCPYVENSHFISLRVKDAIVDRIREKFDGLRPDVDIENPYITIHVHIHKDSAVWYLDFSGEGMAKRGYKVDNNLDVSMKENLAASILLRSEWEKSITDDKVGILLDPFAGTGVIPIEAALIASDMAPGLVNEDREYAFMRLPFHDEALWNEVKEEAKKRCEEAREKRDIRIYASDISGKAVKIMRESAIKAGVSDLISINERDAFTYEENEIAQRGFIVTDPPYGVRMKNDDIGSFYERIGNLLSSSFKGWRATLFAPESELFSYISMKPERTNTLYNGTIECQAAHYLIYTDEEREEQRIKNIRKREERLSAPLSDGAEKIFKHLVERLSVLKSEMEKEGVTCYRIYDAEIEEYPAAIDMYEGKWINLSVYKGPVDGNLDEYEKKLNDIVYATERATGIDIEDIHVKERMEMKGKSQYERLSSKNHFNVANENGLKVLVNFTDYLDTGIFLDHRPIRKYIQENSKGKRFLNLFCYTATATLNAIRGGAVSTVSVDSSSTYLDWALENMKINGYPTTITNFFYKSDVIEYLNQSFDRYDLIFCDPPTFSNSKSRRPFDVQKDHEELIYKSMRLLSPGGTMIFSTNFRRFRMDQKVLDNYFVKEITEDTIGEDFKLRPNIHKCYLIRKKVKVSLKKR